MKNFTTILLVTAGLLLSYGASAQRTISPSNNTEEGYKTRPKPPISQKSIDLAFERLRYTLLGQACSGDELRPLSSDEWEVVLESYKRKGEYTADDEAVARDRITRMQNDTRDILNLVMGAKNVSLFASQAMYSGSDFMYEIVELNTEVIDGKEQPQYISWLLIVWEDDYRIFYAHVPSD